MKEMIERLIADGWEWVTRNQDATIRIFRGSKPVFVEERGVFENKENLCLQIPSCLFTDITFETSPLELKTLSVDDTEGQKILKNLLQSGFTHIIKDIRGNLEAINETSGCPLNIQVLSSICTEKYKLYEIKDLIKKSKVKKSVWYCRQADAELLLFDEKPIRNGGDWALSEGGNYTVLDNGIIDIDWEDEPIELTYEVEE